MVMGKVCYAIGDDVGDDKVFFGKEYERKNIKNNKEICPHGAYTCRGPQGSINVRIALVCLNTTPNCELFVYMCVYAFVKHAKDVCRWN